MSSIVDVTFELSVPRGIRAEVPVGYVHGVEVAGERSRRLKPAFGRTVLHVPMPEDPALQIVRFHRRHIRGHDSHYNCLAFMCRVAFNKVPGVAELYERIGPKLVPGRFRTLPPSEVLRPAVGYAFATQQGYIEHGVVGIGIADRQLEVDEHAGRMRIISTNGQLADYKDNLNVPFSVAEVGPDSYRSSEPLHPMATSRPLAGTA